MKHPVVELSECILCGVCVEVCPEVFSMTDGGYVAVAEMTDYPRMAVDEAIMCCPADCIHWESN